MAKSVIESASPCEPIELARVLFALADPTRMRMINLMLNREVTSRQFARVFARGSSVINRHLTCLRRGKLLATRRRGRITHYIVREGLSSTESMLLRLTVESLRSHSGLLQKDVDVLNSIGKKQRGSRNRVRALCCSTVQDPVPIIPGDGPVLDRVLVDDASCFTQSARGRA
jgi:DNA-binding transcriptional ArsR family regulator